MLKLFKKRKKGFTLTETIVVIALLAIIMACVVAFSSPVRSMIRNTSSKGDALSIDKIMGDYLERRLAYASSVHAFTEINFDTILSGGSCQKLTDQLTECLGTLGTPGMIVIKYEPDSLVPFKSTYKLYDVSLTGASDMDDTIENVSGHVQIKDAVFADAFYADYEYFIGLDQNVEVNSQKNKCYIAFDINAFNFTEDYGYTFDTTTISRYYDPVTLPSGAKDKGINLMNEEKLGTERVSFCLENITSKETVVEDPPGSGIYVPFTSIPGCTIQNIRQEAAANPALSAQVGSDIVIFYNIQRY